MPETVVVVGGGYAGIAVAKALDDVADVVLVEPREALFHSVAALRGVVDPAWSGRLFLPYDRLLSRGRVVRDRAVRVDPTGVVLGSGARIDADFLVLATGSRYPFPAKTELEDTASATAAFRTAQTVLASVDRILLLGAGPVGLELAGEITAAWPDKSVTIVDPAPDVLSGPLPAALRAELRRQLEVRGVELLLGASLSEPPGTDPGTPGEFTVVTSTGGKITADLWFRCFGVVPVSDHLTADLVDARRPDGHVEVTPDLRLVGQRTVFVAGDLAATGEAPTASAAGRHAEIVAANIRALIDGAADLLRYEPPAPGIAVPLGPGGGASYSDELGLVGAATTAEIKGADLMVEFYRDYLGLT
ncbi:NADH dehydrogenase FAD-containing subunit [Actinoalloteichus hoggarensis]|uniref:Nitric oxide reductase FlRd-NAD(+) reductase n=1 Tax=Actinoalloteichus hoggarensis TaxID=1470176 RepID=A0A221W468_9PSEU|nr:FAD-dependent oxidoreductase [Actinoalloteichus hoggarensis]ASO20441.1 Nitric oxide reductase FlRd-NAD(+) reductase [Actinoalloteichus hoggarensis]MBB5923480.1 NADH dehydrogenase FAD-containing subunit [Actinoalloteichus hoggarensis]